jgi:hypothetical protein
MKELWSEFLPILKATIISFVLLAILFPMSAVFPEQYPDIIFGDISMQCSNKTQELQITWFVLVVASFILYWFVKKNKGIVLTRFDNKILPPVTQYFIGFFLIPMCVLWLFNGSIKPIVLHITFFLSICSILLESNKLKGYIYSLNLNKIVLLLITTYYFVLAVLSLVNYKHPLFNLSFDTIERFTIFCVSAFLLVLFKKKKTIYIDRIIIFQQIFIPLILLVFCLNRYMYNNEIINLEWNYKYKYVIFSLIILLMVSSLKNCINYTSKITRELKVNELISLSFVITVFILNSYQGPELVFNKDLWHCGDELLGWQQLIDQGMIAYQEYNPAAGLFSLLFGFFQNIVLQSDIMHFNATFSLEHIFFAIVIAVLIYYRGNTVLALILGMLYGALALGYTRILMVLPVILILSSPFFLERRLLWIAVWGICSQVSILFYPLNGVAVMLGMFPFCVVKILNIIKNKKSNMKETEKWHIGIFLVCVGMFIVMEPLLYRMAKHILLMAGQTIWADGMSVYKFSHCPEWFLSYLGNSLLRQILYYAFRFTLPIIAILLYLYSIFLIIKRNSYREYINKPSFVLLVSGLIAILISYKFTFIRMDPDGLLARMAPTLSLFLGVILPLAIWQNKLNISYKLCNIILVGVSVGLSILIGGSPLGDEYQKIKPVYNISEQYVLVNGDDIGIPKIGKGFIEKNILNEIKTINETVEKFTVRDESFIDMSLQQGLYYILDKKAIIPDGGTYVVADYRTQEHNIDKMNKNMPPIVVWNHYLGLRNYYMYSWLLDHNYVLYEKNGQYFFIRPDRYIITGKDFEQNHEAMKNTPVNTFILSNIEGTAAAWGNSLDSLKNVLTKVEKNNIAIDSFGLKQKDQSFYAMGQSCGFIIAFSESIKGSEADFLYVNIQGEDEFKNMNWLKNQFKEKFGISRRNGEVKVFWRSEDGIFSNEQEIVCSYINGKLLIPVGACPSWRFENIKSIKIEINGIEVNTKLHINEISLFKTQNS